MAIYLNNILRSKCLTRPYHLVFIVAQLGCTKLIESMSKRFPIASREYENDVLYLLRPVIDMVGTFGGTV